MPEAIGIVGAGAVAGALGRLLDRHGMKVTVLASRTGSRAERTAAFIGPSVRTVGVAELPGLVTRVIVATTDVAVTPVAELLARAGFAGMALHTSGAQGADALAPLRHSGVSCGVLHPFQTVASAEQGVACLPGVTWRIEGDPAALAWARQIAATLSGRTIDIATDRLPMYHAAAVLGGNGLTALVDAAVLLLEHSGVDRRAAVAAVTSLSRTTLENVLGHGPEAALTGPVARGDAATIEAHLDALFAHAPELAPLYEAVSRRLMDIAGRRGLPDEDLKALGAALSARGAGSANAH